MPKIAARSDYFDAAMRILGERGYGALKIGPLCRAVGVTTGSFYHYFGSWDGFVAALLEHWEREQTQRIITLSTESPDPRERISRLKALALTLPHEAETAIRAWSNSNEQVHAVQKRVDAERVDALRLVIGGVVHSKRRTDLLAVLGLTLLVGLQQTRSPVDVRELALLFEEYEALILREAP